jgi:glycerate dehydrogenase
MKIVFLDSATMGDDISLSGIEALGELACWPVTTPDEVIQRVSGADVIITNKVVISREAIDAAKNLKLICVAATGMNNVDTAYATLKGIPVKNAVGYSTDSVLQVTFTLIFGLIGKLLLYDSYVKNGKYSGGVMYTNVKDKFHEIRGMKLGVIGMGNIGKKVAQAATLFGAEVSYYSTSGTSHCKEYPSLSLKELLSSSDIVSIHSPLNDRTKDLIAREQLKWMKREAIIINMGRGGIVNESDLASALDEGIIAGAGVDVFEQEPFPKDHPYMKIIHKERILLTPHIGWASVEARKRLIGIVASNIASLT